MKALHKFTCPYCQKEVETFWEDNEDGTTQGLLRGDYTLIADWVYHTKCWDDFVKEHPPQMEF